jgi:hypothetical protein
MPMRPASARPVLRALAASAILATPSLVAQAFVPVPTGATPVPLTPTMTFPADDEGITAALPLGFSFPMPDGTTTTSIVATSNGRIGASLATSDFSPTVADFLGGVTAICPFWYDLTNATVFFDTTSVPGTAVVTWRDVFVFSGAVPFSFQAQLASTGAVTFVYDDRIEGAGPVFGIVGLTPGGGAVDPGESDYTRVGISGPFLAGSTVYEQFLSAPIDGFDLVPPSGAPAAGITFTPAGPGSYVVDGNIDVRVPATTEPGRAACTPFPPTPVSLTWTPTFPGYVLTAAGSFDAAAQSAGTSLGLGDDVIVNRALPFPMPMPGGATVTSIDIDSNGRILSPGTGEASDFSATVGEFLGDPVAQICPFWSDLTPGFPSGTPNDVVFYVDPSNTRAVVTWVHVPQFLFPNSNNTFQIELLVDGTIRTHYESIEYDDSSFPALIGVSPGGGAPDPDGESDLSLAAASADDVFYEIFSNEGPDLAAPPALPNEGVSLIAATAPRIGTTFQVDTVDTAGTATAAVYLFGFPTGVVTPSIPLGFLNPALANCEILTDIVAPGSLLASPGGTPGTPTPLFSIPADPTLIGLSGLVVSAVLVDPTRTPTLFPTDELVVTIGNT